MNWLDFTRFITKQLLIEGWQAIMILSVSFSPIIWQHPNCSYMGFWLMVKFPPRPLSPTISQIPWMSSRTNKDLSVTLRIERRLIFYTLKKDLSYLRSLLSCALAVSSQVMTSVAETMNRKYLPSASQISAARNLLTVAQPEIQSHQVFSNLHKTILFLSIIKTLPLYSFITIRSDERSFFFSKKLLQTVCTSLGFQIEMKYPKPSLVRTKILSLMISNYSIMFSYYPRVVSFQQIFVSRLSVRLPLERRS